MRSKTWHLHKHWSKKPSVSFLPSFTSSYWPWPLAISGSTLSSRKCTKACPCSSRTSFCYSTVGRVRLMSYTWAWPVSTTTVCHNCSSTLTTRAWLSTSWVSTTIQFTGLESSGSCASSSIGALVCSKPSLSSCLPSGCELLTESMQVAAGHPMLYGIKLKRNRSKSSGCISSSARSTLSSLP